jgi:hypothetical protein
MATDTEHDKVRVQAEKIALRLVELNTILAAASKGRVTVADALHRAAAEADGWNLNGHHTAALRRAGVPDPSPRCTAAMEKRRDAFRRKQEREGTTGRGAGVRA